MPNAIELYVDAYEDARDYVRVVRVGTAALTELQNVRQQIVDRLVLIQASSVYDAAVKTAAQAMATQLRADIIAFADSL